MGIGAGSWVLVNCLTGRLCSNIKHIDRKIVATCIYTISITLRPLEKNSQTGNKYGSRIPGSQQKLNWGLWPNLLPENRIG